MPNKNCCFYPLQGPRGPVGERGPEGPPGRVDIGFASTKLISGDWCLLIQMEMFHIQ